VWHRTLTIADDFPLQSLSLEGIRARKQAIHHHYPTLHLPINPSNAENEMTIREAQEAVDRWIKEYGVRYFSELTNMAVLTEEVGELARVIARKYGDQSFKEGEHENLGEEMADVLWVLICLANQTGIDLTEELLKSLEKKTHRDALRHIENPKLKA
jgi:NTP pyrophosphatase (non-canonical NTP hydrolase)